MATESRQDAIGAGSVLLPRSDCFTQYEGPNVSRDSYAYIPRRQVAAPLINLFLSRWSRELVISSPTGETLEALSLARSASYPRIRIEVQLPMRSPVPLGIKVNIKHLLLEKRVGGEFHAKSEECTSNCDELIREEKKISKRQPLTKNSVRISKATRALRTARKEFVR